MSPQVGSIHFPYDAKGRKAAKALAKHTGGKVINTKKSMKLGGGGRFAKLAKKVGSPALAAFIGRKKYGAKKFAKLGKK